MAIKYKQSTEAQVQADEQAQIKPKNKTKVFVFILLAIIIVVSLLIVSLTIANYASGKSIIEYAKGFEKVSYTKTQLIPFASDDGYNTFCTNEEFKILQLTDVHVCGGLFTRKKDRLALDAMAAMIRAEQPDLVIFTGDVAYPSLHRAGTFNNLTAMKAFVSCMESLEVYWSFAFGNHDAEDCGIANKSKITQLLESDSLSYCLFQAGEQNVDGSGNHIIKIEDENGIITQALFMIDSHDYAKKGFLGIGKTCDNIHQNQIDWYKNEVLRLDNLNQSKLLNTDEALLLHNKQSYGVMKSLCFFHIPINEMKQCYQRYEQSGKAQIIDEQTTYLYGEAVEGKVGGPTTTDAFFETAVQLGSTKGMFFGHDHLNNIAFEYKGITLAYGMSIDYTAYWDIKNLDEQRGCKVIKCQTDGTFESYNEHYTAPKYHDTTK